MSELQLALIAVGVAAVATVWGYNRWQERRQQQLAEKLFGDRSGDVLEVANDSAGGEERREPVIEANESLPPLPEAWADEIADCVVRIDFAEPVSALSVWQTQAEWSGQIEHSVQWLGLDSMLQHWRQLGEGDIGRYAVVCAAMQLADRRGPVSEREISLFLDGLHELLRRYPGVAQIPAADDVLVRARAVDDACIAVDMQLALNVVPASGRPFDGAAFRHAIEEAGFALQSDGLFHCAEDLFMLARLGGGAFDEFPEDAMEQGVTLTLDVPRVADGLLAFDRLLALVGELTTRFDCALVDAQRNALAAEAISAIQAKIADLQGQMGQRRIAPGSVRARRLFS